jgi:bifunctional UDP-N-acetylglucosamine pyrophosphorylase/glucosamine-1-phosphate N-acetyltransferase
LEDADEARGLNDPKELEEVRTLFRMRILDQLQEDGVQVVAPDLTYVESGVCVAAGSVLHPFTVIRRGVSIAAPCSVGPFAHVRPGPARGDNGGPGDFVDGAAFRADTVVVPPSST